MIKVEKYLKKEKNNHEIIKSVPVLPVRNLVFFPFMISSLYVSRQHSLLSLEKAVNTDNMLFLITQKDACIDKPDVNDVYHVGVLVEIFQVLRLNEEYSAKVLIRARQRAKLYLSSRSKYGFSKTKSFYSSDVSVLENTCSFDQIHDIKGLISVACRSFEQYMEHHSDIAPDILHSLKDHDEDPDIVAYVIAIHIHLSCEDKQKILEMDHVVDRLEYLIEHLEVKNDQIKIDRRVRDRVKKRVEETHRKFYLSEQLDALREELEKVGGGTAVNDLQHLEMAIKNIEMSEEAKKKAQSEYEKLKNIPVVSAERTVVYNYIEYLVKLPWGKFTPTQLDIDQARDILNQRHYALDKVKQRILEHIAVEQRLNQIHDENQSAPHRSTIFCFVGAPGVGKTSLVQSIANAMGRKFERISLGGVCDEAEIRGHRRTYVAALPGKIILKLIKAGVNNPVICLDEIDKISSNSRGDPTSALLEVLDPEQNTAFEDHYLEVSYNLSQVVFIATANSLNIHPALLDRLEIIRLPGYTDQEKMSIAIQHILPKQIKNHGLREGELCINKPALLDILHYYTREAGVRDLERNVSKLCRKSVHKIVTQKVDRINITRRHLAQYLGVRRYHFDEVTRGSRIGQVNGLAWTEVGGELLTIEAAVFAGRGKLIHTGSLGDVMQESIRAAMTVVRSRVEPLKLGEDYFQKHNIHVHVPEGATPKDGPSAGLGMCIAMLSVLSGIPVYHDIAMTGEITLSGEVLPIGGLKEKLLAALRSKLRLVLIPKKNEKDLAEIPKRVQQELIIYPVSWLDEAVAKALIHPIKKDI